MKFFPFYILILLGVLLPSCSATRACKEPDLRLPSHMLPELAEDDSATIADLSWIEFFGDSTLCSIIRQTLDSNRTLMAAAARVEAAREAYNISKADQFPTVGAFAHGEVENLHYNGTRSSRDPEWDLKATLSWEADLWGKYRHARRAGLARWEASLEDLRAMRITLISEAATAYFNLVALDNELAIVRRTLLNREEGMAKARLRFEGGLTSELVYQQAQVEYTSTATYVPMLESRIRATENAISILMGRLPGEAPVPRGNFSLPLLSSDSIPMGVPSELLRRRPDLRGAEASLRAAMEDVGVAWADRFPSLSFSLNGGLENEQLSRFFASPASFLGGSLAGPIFDFGRRKAKYKRAIATYDAARLSYEQAVLNAFRETDNAATNFYRQRQSTLLKSASRNSAQKYVDLATLQYVAGSISYLDVLDAQRRFFDAQISLSNALRDENLALIALYRALGGAF